MVEKPNIPEQKVSRRNRNLKSMSDNELLAFVYSKYGKVARYTLQKRDRALYQALYRRGLHQKLTKEGHMEGDGEKKKASGKRKFREMDDEGLLDFVHSEYGNITPNALQLLDQSLYMTLYRRGLHLKLTPKNRKARKWAHRSNDVILRYARIYAPFVFSGKCISVIDPGLYQILLKRGLIVNGVAPDLKEYWSKILDPELSSIDN